MIFATRKVDKLDRARTFKSLTKVGLFKNQSPMTLGTLSQTKSVLTSQVKRVISKYYSPRRKYCASLHITK